MIRHILVIDSCTVLRTMLIAGALAAAALVALLAAAGGGFAPGAAAAPWGRHGSGSDV